MREAGPRERRGEPDLQVRELERRQILGVDGERARALADVRPDRGDERILRAPRVGLLQELRYEPRELRPKQRSASEAARIDQGAQERT